MIVEHYIKVCFPISDKTREFRLSKGAELYTHKVCDPMILFLVEQFEQNSDCLIGDIRSLYQRKKEIIENKSNEMTYLEYLQNRRRK